MVDLETVFNYYRRGLSVIPLIRGGKKPKIPWEEYQKHRATEEQIRDWFVNDWNFGIICGGVSGNLVVLDFDDAEAVKFVFKDFEKIKKKTMLVRTGRGYHIYFRTKTPVPSGKRARLHLDIQSEGKYVVGPASLHPSGAIYNPIGAEAIAQIDDFVGFLDGIDKKDSLYDAAKAIGAVWHTGDRHDITLRVASLLRKQLHWELDETKEFVLSIMRMLEDNDELPDRLRAIGDAYTKDYSYISTDMPKTLVDDILKLLPTDTKELWRVNLDEKIVGSIYCDSSGVYYSKKSKDSKNIFPIFSAPLILTDCYTIQGELENDKVFSLSLGKQKYTGSKSDIVNNIIASSTTGINQRYFSEAINACVEYYISKKIVIPREAYPAVGVYTDGRKFIPAFPGEKNVDISPEYGEETYFVFKQFKKYSGNFIESLETFNKLCKFFPGTQTVMLEGFSVIAPFMFALKSTGDLYIPLMILKGPRGTGKTALGEIFTTYMYTVETGDPSDATSEYRLLDFVNGTTFPRLVDESENVKFEGGKLTPKASATLKYNAFKQIVGTRGEIKNKRVQKRIYYGRTPLIMAGNKIDMNDPALIGRSIFLIFFEKPKNSRGLFRDEILNKLEKGFGQEITKWICEKYTFNGLVEKIRKNKIDYDFRDPRREDFYAEMYTGLELLNEIYHENGMEYSYSNFLDKKEFAKIVGTIEESNMDEEEERQNIQILIDWARTMADALSDYEGVEKPPFNVALLRSSIELAEENNKQWIYLSQTGLNEFCSQNRDMPFRTLSLCADELSKFYGVPREIFYDRKAVRINGRPTKALKIPYDGIGLDNYGGYTSGGRVSGGGEQDGKQWLHFDEKSTSELQKPLKTQAEQVVTFMQNTSKSAVNPVNSNARSEIHPVTEENGNLVRDQLLALGYHVSPSSGPDINRKFYSIQVIGVLSLPPDMKEKLYHLMHMDHFTLASESQHRALFTRPLIKASDAVIHASPSNPEDLRREVIETVRMESPKSQYGSLTPDAVYKIVGGRFQDIRVAEIKEICEQEYNKGTLIRRGPGYFYNSEGA